MTRFFFDYTSKDRSLLDYQGHEFKGPEGAFDFAEAIAHDLKHSLLANWSGWSIEVRNAEGIKFLSMPVDEPELRAA